MFSTTTVCNPNRGKLRTNTTVALIKKQKTASKNRDTRIMCRSKETLRDISTIKRSGPIWILIQKQRLFFKGRGGHLLDNRKNVSIDLDI